MQLTLHSASYTKLDVLYLLQDVVTREGKMLFLYKRPGQRVILNAAGHMMVRPTHVEASVQKNTGGG